MPHGMMSRPRACARVEEVLLARRRRPAPGGAGALAAWAAAGSSASPRGCAASPPRRVPASGRGRSRWSSPRSCGLADRLGAGVGDDGERDVLADVEAEVREGGELGRPSGAGASPCGTCTGSPRARRRRSRRRGRCPRPSGEGRSSSGRPVAARLRRARPSSACVWYSGWVLR